MAADKGYLTYQEFLRQFDGGTVRPIYLFQGAESFLMEEALEHVKQALIQESAADFNFNKFSATDVEIGAVLDQAQTMPFLSKYRLIVLTGVDALSAAAQKALLPYLSNPNPSACVILIAEKLDARTKFAQTLKKQAETVQFWKLFETDVPRWITARAKQAGYAMSVQTAGELLECVGNDLRQLDNELKKIMAYAPAREITSQIVHQVVGDIRERDIFELVDAVGQGNTLAALKILGQLLIEGEQPLKILAMITRQYRLLWRLKATQTFEPGSNSRNLAGQLGVSPRNVEQLQRQTARFSQVQLKLGMKRLYDVDRALKSSVSSPKILLEDVVFDLCAREKAA
jgi:DNA polymerase III subunit delta